LSSSFIGSSSTSGSAQLTGPEAQLASSVLQAGLSLLAQHTARLQAAENENAALDALIPAWDADVRAIVAAYNSGTLLSECVQALTIVDNNAYSYLQKQIGKPGTAWNGSGQCNKQCTAGCCVYYNDLHSAIYGPSGAPYNGSSAAANGACGLIPAMNAGKGCDPTHPGQCYIPEIFPPSDTAYGNYSRAGYYLTVSKPPAKTNTAAQVLTVSGSGTSLTVAPKPAPKPAPAAPPLPASPPVSTTVTAATPAASVLGLLTNTELVTIVGVVGGLLLIIAYLFGPNAVRVNQ
jgi:hypothetical protein